MYLVAAQAIASSVFPGNGTMTPLFMTVI
ncbi:hypothetical protein BGLA2_310089 [Burkholderia gladioli]|nr:hypothetical protein BGLA2_310089 [Burkholderia gladioli]